MLFAVMSHSVSLHHGHVSTKTRASPTTNLVAQYNSSSTKGFRKLVTRAARDFLFFFFFFLFAIIQCTRHVNLGDTSTCQIDEDFDSTCALLLNKEEEYKVDDGIIADCAQKSPSPTCRII